MPRTPRESGLAAVLRHSRPLVLLIALVAYILVGPQVRSGFFKLALQLAVVGACVHMAADRRGHLVLGASLALPAALLLVAGEAAGRPSLTWIGYLFLVGLYASIILLMLRRIFHAPQVSLDEIGLALCAYVLLGMLWVLFYVPLAAEGFSAHFNAAVAPAPDEVNVTLVYFSYVTLTTLGYGDITPISPLARSLAIIEALTGVLFLAVLISRLVGSYSSRRGEAAR